MIDIIEIIKIIILGIVEGVTEFLPISSTGHLIVATALLRPAFSDALAGTFEVFIQLGAVVAVVLFYARDLIARVRALPTSADARRFWLGIVVAFLPAAVVGILLRDFIKTVLFNPAVVAISLIVGGILFLVLERSSLAQRATTDSLEAVTLRQALVIGLAQTVAIIPGVSRSAASIFGAMASGLTRSTATQFSFYLAIPTLGAATLLDLILSLDEIQSNDWVYLILGAIVAGGVAWVSIGWLLRYVAGHNFIAFGWYRIAAGIAILLLVAAQVI